MSGSPKYATPTLLDLALAALNERRDARRRAAREAEQRRLEAVARQEAWRRFSDARGRCDALLKRFARESAVFDRSDAAPLLDKSRAAKLERRAAELCSALHAIDPGDASLDKAHATGDLLAELAEEMGRLRAEARSALEAVQSSGAAGPALAALGRIRGELLDLRARLEVDPGVSTRFDPSGWEDARRCIAAAEAAVGAGDLAAARTGLDAAERAAQRHMSRAKAEREGVADREEEARARLDDLKSRAAALASDGVLARWVGPALAEVAAKQAAIEALHDAGKFSDVLAAARELTLRLEDVENKAEASQALEEKRTFLVEGIMKVMTSQGFSIAPGGPSLEDAASPRSAVIIAATRVDGRRLGVSVPQEGDLWYEVQGFPCQQAATHEGVVSSCDEAEDAIESINGALRELGIDMSPLMWNGKPPNRRRGIGRERAGARDAEREA